MRSLTEAEIVEAEARRTAAELQRQAEEDRARAREADLALLREKAVTDLHFAALLRHLGVD